MSDDDKTSSLPEFSVVSQPAPSEPPQADVVKNHEEEQQMLPQDSHGADDSAAGAPATTSATIPDQGDQDSKISHGDATSAPAAAHGEPPAVTSNAGEPDDEPATTLATVPDQEEQDSKVSRDDATTTADGKRRAVTSNVEETADEPDPDADDATETESPADAEQLVKQYLSDGDIAAGEVPQAQKEESLAVPADVEPAALSAPPSQPHADKDITAESPEAPEEAGNPNLVVGTVTEDISAAAPSDAVHSITTVTDDISAPQTGEALVASVVPVESATTAQTTTEALPDAAPTTTEAQPDAAAAPNATEAGPDAAPASTETQPITTVTKDISALQTEEGGNAASVVPAESASAEAQADAAPTTAETQLDGAVTQPDAVLEEAHKVQEPPVAEEYLASNDGHDETVSGVATNDESPVEEPETADEVIPTTKERAFQEVLVDGTKDDAPEDPPANNGSQLKTSPEAGTADSVPVEENPVAHSSEQKPSEVSSGIDATEEASPPQVEENTATHTEESAPKQPADEGTSLAEEGKVVGAPPQSELAVDESKYDDLNGSVNNESASGGELANQVSGDQVANEQPAPVEPLVTETLRELPDLDETKTSRSVLEVPNGPVENGDQQESKEELSRGFPVDPTETFTQDSEHLNNKSQESQTLSDAKQQKPVSGLKLPLIFAGVAIATAGIVLASVTKSH